VLFTLVVGRPPFNADGAGDIIAMHLREPAPAPSQLRPGIPPDIDRLVLRCLAKSPEQRFLNAAELAAAIGGLPGSLPQVPMACTGGYATASAPTTLSAAAGARAMSPARRSRVNRVAVIGGLGVVASALAMVAPRGSAPRAPAPAPLPASTMDRLSAQAPLPAPAVDRSPVSAPAPQSAPPDPSARATPAIKDALARFVAWSQDHPGAPCPDAAALGAPDDPWGHPPSMTCTEQPGDQIAGAISAGPDGQPGTADDIASWQLGADVTDLVHGVRWSVVAPKPAARPAAVSTPRSAAVVPGRPADVPMKRAPAVQVDENGLPVAR
jgi:serine/threonine-protein kinase